ncbi:MAG: GNAT family N-acetyltransferase [Betaproteobacteria bacterium]|nr:GNAT family N-acetyltransferase [Betaproteobacteria bacterium]
MRRPPSVAERLHRTGPSCSSQTALRALQDRRQRPDEAGQLAETESRHLRQPSANPEISTPNSASHARVSLGAFRSIGRVVVSGLARGRGLGHELIRCAIAACGPCVDIRINAQAYLESFYLQHGFIAQGDVYLEDGIRHQMMLRPACREPDKSKSQAQPPA